MKYLHSKSSPSFPIYLRNQFKFHLCKDFEFHMKYKVIVLLMYVLFKCQIQENHLILFHSELKKLSFQNEIKELN